MMVFHASFNAIIVYGQSDFNSNSVAITSSASLDSPSAVHLDTAGNLWVADTLNNRVLRFGSATLIAPTTQPPIVTATTFDGSLVVQNSVVLSVFAVLSITQDLIIRDAGLLDISAGGSVQVSGNAKVMGQLAVSQGTSLDVADVFVVAANSTLRLSFTPIPGQTQVTLVVANYRSSSGQFSTIQAPPPPPCFIYGTPSQNFGMSSLTSTVTITQIPGCSTEESGLSVGAIVGIAVGAIVVAIICVLLIVAVKVRSDRRHKEVFKQDQLRKLEGHEL